MSVLKKARMKTLDTRHWNVSSTRLLQSCRAQPEAERQRDGAAGAGRVRRLRCSAQPEGEPVEALGPPPRALAVGAGETESAKGRSGPGPGIFARWACALCVRGITLFEMTATGRYKLPVIDDWDD